MSSNGENAKLRQKGSGGGHVTQFWNFGSCQGHATHFWNFKTPLISRERLELETSNLAQRLRGVSSNGENAKLRQKESCGGHVTQF